MGKKKIVFVHNVEYPQQWWVDIFYYSKYLSRYKDYDITVIVSDINESIKNQNLYIIALWKRNYFSFVIRAFSQIKKIHKNTKIDYVYFFAQHPMSVLLQIWVKYFLRISTIYDVVSGPIWKWFFSLVSKYTIQLWVYFSHFYIVLHEWLIERLQLTKKKPFAVVWMWYDEDIFFPIEEIDLFQKKENEIVFTYIGSLDKNRKLDVIIQSFIYYCKKNENLRLYIIGCWNAWEELINLASWYKDKNIFFLWTKNHSEIPLYVNSSDILISYVPQEDYFEYQPPTKLIEYLSCNKPVIVTKTLAQSQIMKDFDDLVCDDDIESVKKIMQYTIENIDDISKRDFVNQVDTYRWSQLVERIKNLIDNDMNSTGEEIL